MRGTGGGRGRERVQAALSGIHYVSDTAKVTMYTISIVSATPTSTPS